MPCEMGSEERLLIERYLALLYRWTASVNLTRVSPELAWARHVGESLALLDLCEWQSGATVADLGSGGGLPGIPLAVMRQGVRFLLVERTAKKAAFLSYAVRELGLGNVRVLAAEARECPRREGWQPVDAVVSRAAGKPTTVAPLALGLLRVGGAALLIVAGSTELSVELVRSCRAAGGSSPELLRSGEVTALRLRRQS